MDSLDLGPALSPRHLSLPSDSNSGNDISEMMRSNERTLGLGDTGRMISNALSDSFLPGIGIDDTPHVSIM